MADIKQQFFERFLRELFQRRGEGFVLKGGAAMQALFEPHRLTKDIDLDFANPKRSADSLHNSIARALQVAARVTRVNDYSVKTPGRAEQSPRWKINFTDRLGQRHHLEVEVSRAQERATPSAPIQVRYAPRAAVGMAPFWVDLYDKPALIASKLTALLGRKVPAPRDIYDLEKLCADAGPVDDELIQWALHRAGVGDVDPLVLLRDRLNELGWAAFQSQLLDALPSDEAERMNEAEWQAMKDRVSAYLEGLLQ